ncbi:hypothetical protein SAMN05444410_103152 [Hydrobacter penzbergensis]|uniref:Uncharacterized protein n=1 Tax=Hydrobacter penzbergensis TaxID=1235997 RepID=A0A8X8LE97_9BACT|nr:hypothetical protein [Hydrobacter penzbergensis]SDW50828.1 hypothetical protein SAMN05444410_103152 [Hydrobacter penzbergensis]
MKRELPVYNIEGTDFIVDVANLQLREKANPENVIPVFDMRDVGDGYVFDYSPKEKNIPMLFSDDTDVRTVKIPELVQLDATGMAEKYGLSANNVQGKTDFELMVDQQALGRRLMGQLPTIDIAGHTFYVDIRMSMLRPKDDFLSNGIVLSQIDNFYDDERKIYAFPYNPKTHEFQELDYDNITAIPKDLIVVSFPHESILDPVGFNRKHGLDETNGLKETNVKSHFEATRVDWKETGIETTIRENINKQHQQQRLKQKDEKQKPGKRQRRGPKL